jgi:hypothetical protein
MKNPEIKIHPRMPGRYQIMIHVFSGTPNVTLRTDLHSPQQVPCRVDETKLCLALN